MPKKPLRETRRENQSAHKFYGAMYGKPPMVDENLKPKREIVNRSDMYELEASVKTDITECLSNHPKVLFAVMQNSGAAFYIREGEEIPVWFYHILKTPDGIDMTIVDYWGLLTDFRFFAVEAKRRNWTKPMNKREHEQAAFLQMVRDAGGIGVFATCAEDVLQVFNKEVRGATSTVVLGNREE